MKTTVDRHSFARAFEAMGRDKQFSRDGLAALFEYLEDLESSTGEEMELDVIALCCDYSEYSSPLEAAKEMGDFEPDEDDEDAQNEAARQYLCDSTQVIEFDGGVIVAAF